MRIIVTGGRGSLGSLVVPLLREAGHDVTVTSRSPQTDQEVLLNFKTGEGLDALKADTVIHLASDPTNTQAVDIEGTQQLVSAISPTTHLIYISIVGVDDHPFKYYAGKRQAETAVEGHRGPWTILRTTQFHSLVGRFLDPVSWMPVLPIPSGTLVQPIDPTLVAERVVELVARDELGRVPDMGGPERIDSVDLARDHLRSLGRRTACLPVRYPGRAAAAFRSGSILTDNATSEGRTWRTWLEETV